MTHKAIKKEYTGKKADKPQGSNAEGLLTSTARLFKLAFYKEDKTLDKWALFTLVGAISFDVLTTFLAWHIGSNNFLGSMVIGNIEKVPNNNATESIRNTIIGENAEKILLTLGITMITKMAAASLYNITAIEISRNAKKNIINEWYKTYGNKADLTSQELLSNARDNIENGAIQFENVAKGLVSGTINIAFSFAKLLSTGSTFLLKYNFVMGGFQLGAAYLNKFLFSKIKDLSQENKNAPFKFKGGTKKEVAALIKNEDKQIQKEYLLLFSKILMGFLTGTHTQLGEKRGVKYANIYSQYKSNKNPRLDTTKADAESSIFLEAASLVGFIGNNHFRMSDLGKRCENTLIYVRKIRADRHEDTENLESRHINENASWTQKTNTTTKGTLRAR